MELRDVIVEEIDILKTMEVLNEKLRNSASQNLTEKQMKVYDTGVKNTMNCLEMLITHQQDGEKNRLIYQKYGEATEVCEYRKLSDILKEVENKEIGK